jgi:hypothetical protein
MIHRIFKHFMEIDNQNNKTRRSGNRQNRPNLTWLCLNRQEDIACWPFVIDHHFQEVVSRRAHRLTPPEGSKDRVVGG